MFEIPRLVYQYLLLEVWFASLIFVSTTDGHIALARK